jgi:hypothetical protein
MTASIYDLIQRELAERPDAPLDLERFPEIPLADDSELTMAPGLRDHLFGGSPESAASALRVLREVLAGDGSWERLDRELRTSPMVGVFDEVVPQLGEQPRTQEAKALFRTLAHRATNYEPAKWGIALGYLDAAQNGDLSAHDVEFLLDCARHPELTPAASPILRIAAANDPDLKLIHLRLLPLTTDWGVVELIRELERTPELLADESAQRQVLIHGARNGAGLSMECYFDIARIVDFASWIERAEDDDEVFSAVAQIMDGLCTERQPRGGLADRADAEHLLTAFIRVLDNRPASLDGLYAIGNLEAFLESTPDWPTRAAWEATLARLYRDKRSSELLRDAMSDAESAWKAGAVIRRHHETDTADAVADWHRRRPDYSTIATLATVGRPEDQELLAAPLEAVDWQQRERRERLDRRTLGRPDPEDNKLVSSLEALGRWPNDRSSRLIALAARDFDPDWRCAAARAIHDWPPDDLPPPLRHALDALWNDRALFVSNAAKSAAAKHGIARRRGRIQRLLGRPFRQPRPRS